MRLHSEVMMDLRIAYIMEGGSLEGLMACR